jgi:phosphatidylglycerophosphate synthase
MEESFAIAERIPWSQAYAELKHAQKPRPGVSMYSHFVNRKLGRLFAASGAALGVSPNLVTAVSAGMTGGAVLLLALTRPTVVSGFAIGLLLVVAFALDAADGQLARLQRSGSASGEWLDHVVDAAKCVGIHAAVLIAAYRYLDVAEEWLLVPLAFQLVAVTVFAGGMLRELLGRVNTVRRKARNDGSVWRSVILLPADSGVLALTFLSLAWTGLFQILYTSLALANLIVGAALIFKWYRELRRSS